MARFRTFPQRRYRIHFRCRTGPETFLRHPCVRYFVREEKKKLCYDFPPLLRFFVCLILWWNLSTKARIVGGLWMAVGIAVGAWKTRGLRCNLIEFELAPEES